MNATLKSLRCPATAALKTLALRNSGNSVSSLTRFGAHCITEGRQWTANSVLHRMAFSASSASISKSKADDKLVRLLDSEIQSASDAGLEAPEGSIFFDVEDKPGEQSVVLKKQYGNEDIKVEVLPRMFGEEDNEKVEEQAADNENAESHINLNVSISKGNGPSLEFTCSAYPDEVMIDSVAIKKFASDSTERMKYEGPLFEDLDENVQKSFHDYLEARGISPSLTNYMAEYMIYKEGKEYIRWLKDIKEFVES